LNAEATRKSSGRILNYLIPHLPELIGGSADLTESNNTKTSFHKAKYIHYGIREHGMAGIMNGIRLYNGFIPYGGTFLAFSDYMRPSIRLSALMKQKVIYVLTHDSIGLGEDGATHQPIEHLAAFRAMPELLTLRPGDAIETLECWEIALNTNGPSILALTRQEVSQFRSDMNENKSSKGGYILQDALHPHITIIATGSEVEIALQVKHLLSTHSLRVRVVSMPCTTLFDQQDPLYQKEVLGNSLLKIAIEAACKFGWEKYIGLDGMFFGVNQFGASGKKQDLYQCFDLVPEKIAEKIILKFNEVISEKDSN
jgi:transketolase